MWRKTGFFFFFRFFALKIFYCSVKYALFSILLSVHNKWINFLGRNDAGLAAAELALAVEKHVLESGSIDTVGTVGM